MSSQTIKLPSIWRLTADTGRVFAKHWWRYMLIAALVAVPISLLSWLFQADQVGAFNAYANIAVLIMDVALMYAVIHAVKSHLKPKLAKSYYDGSASFLRFVLTLTVIIFMAMPAGLGIVIYLIGADPSTNNITLADQLILGLVGLLLAIPTVWWLGRFTLSLYGAVEAGLRPWDALRFSRRLTLGRYWAVTGRLAYMMVLTLLLLTALYIPVVYLAMLLGQDQTFVNAIYGVVVNVLLLAPVNIYLFLLYDAVASLHLPADPKPEPEPVVEEALSAEGLL
ncbi:MAG TPA: hypothetical protein VLF67_04560 [Candidatus Saccharimonas sp.]|nr:hypothetical protein [Candidatus Saccharimonas sp.]